MPINNSPRRFEDIYSDFGAFKYDDLGFSISYEGFTKSIAWADITQINVYKADHLTIDRIEMEIVYNDHMFTIREDLPGWYQYVLRSKEKFPTIPEDWDIKIIQPAFETNYSTIYDKTKLDQVENK